MDSRLQAQGRSGPRVIRANPLETGTMGIDFCVFARNASASIHNGHILLGFSLHAMVLLYITGGTGVLEHLGEPSDPEAASMWRPPLIRMLLSLDELKLYECAQWLLGADSVKRTGLLALNLQHLPITLRRNALCPELPKHQPIGIDDQGLFRTAKLEEYPPAFCRALAEAFSQNFPPQQGEDLQPLPAEFLDNCRKLPCTDFGTCIGADFAGMR